MPSRYRFAALLLVFLAPACGSPTSPSSSSISAGQWRGTTEQGAAIEFTVSPDDILTSLTIGHNFNGCSGSQTFSNLQIDTASQCLGGACPSTMNSYRALTFESVGTRGVDPITSVQGIFIPSGQVQGFAMFQDFPGCGTAEYVMWTASRR